MKKKTQVIIKQKDCILGKPGTIINVAHGYAFNYLIPNNIADLGTKGKLKHASMLEEVQQKYVEAHRVEAIAIQKNLSQISKITIKKKVGENQQIFGSVNEKEIIAEIINYTGQKLEKKQIKLPEIKQIGIYSMNINILDNIAVNLKLQIVPENI